MEREAFELLMDRFNSMDRKLDSLEKKAEAHADFKAWVLGLAAGVSAAISFVFNLFSHK